MATSAGELLNGKRCTVCSGGSVDPGRFCSQGCGQTMVDHSFTAVGTVYASTLIHVPAPGLPTPYQVGYVDLPEGLRLFGHFETADPVLPDRRVRVVELARPVDHAGPFVRYRFLPDGPSDERVSNDG